MKLRLHNKTVVTIRPQEPAVGDVTYRYGTSLALRSNGKLYKLGIRSKTRVCTV